MGTSGYENEFQDALERTDSWGLCAPYFKASDKQYIDQNSLQKLAESFKDFLRELHPSQISQQCFAVNYFMQRPLEKLLGTPLAYTLGYVEHNQNNLFYTPEDQLRGRLSTPASLKPIDLHAWLTTPSYEIIDLTLSTTFGVATDNPECIGLIAAQHHSLFTKDLRHHPQIIGKDFLSTIGLLLRIDWE